MKFTPITVKARSRSELACLGSTADAAIAAAAPQTPVAQPVSRPKSRDSPNRRAAQAPNTMVQLTAASAIRTGRAPPSTSCPNVRRAPYSATPTRSKVRPANSMPGFSTARSDNGCNPMPMTRVRMSGGTQTAPNRRKFCLSATKATAAMTAHSATPGATRRRLSGAQRRTISTATALLRIKNGDELAFADRLAFADLDFPDDAGLGREHGDFHLHRFEDHDLAFDLDPVAGLGLDLPDVARDLRLHIDDGHAPFTS